MNDTYVQIVNALGNIDPIVAGGVALALATVGGYYRLTKKSKENSNDNGDRDETPEEKNARLNKVSEEKSLSDFTMATKEFRLDDYNHSKMNDSDQYTITNIDYNPKPKTSFEKNNDGIDYQEVINDPVMEKPTIQEANISFKNSNDNDFDIIEELSKGDNSKEETNVSASFIDPISEEKVEDKATLSQDVPVFSFGEETVSEVSVTEHVEIHQTPTSSDAFLNKQEDKETISDFSSNESREEDMGIDMSDLLAINSSNTEAQVTTSEDLPSIEQVEVRDLIIEESVDHNANNVPEVSEVGILLSFAVEQDLHKNKEDAITYINQAIAAEENFAEKIRLKIILKEYSLKNSSLQSIIDSLPTIKQIEEKTSSSTPVEIQPVRFIDPNNLQVKEKTYDPIEDEQEFNSNEEEIATSSVEKVDTSDLMVSMETQQEPTTSEKQIIDLVEEANSMPSLDGVSFANVGADSEAEAQKTENIFSTLAIAIDKDAAEKEQKAIEGQELFEQGFSEILKRNKEEAIIALDPALDPTNKSTIKEVSTLQFSETMNLAVPADVIEKRKALEAEKEKANANKVWVHFTVYVDEKIKVDNKKFQLTDTWGSVDSHISLNKQINHYVKTNYGSEAKYAITLVLSI